MTTSVVTFATFKQASEFAKFAAKVLQRTIHMSSREIDDDIEVYLPDDADRILRHSALYGHLFSHVIDHEAAESAIEWGAAYRSPDDEAKEMGEEIDDDRESWARSDEAGWFYREGED